MAPAAWATDSDNTVERITFYPWRVAVDDGWKTLSAEEFGGIDRSNEFAAWPANSAELRLFVAGTQPFNVVQMDVDAFH